eukprot:m.205411 g.205411  ORF g.205411 m.205411 type:complete len:320 (+) comp18875_c0_seq2:98-1057(+)
MSTRGGSRKGNFMEKPDAGWSHNSAALSVGQGVYYSFPVRYIGSIQVIESLRSLNMDDKTLVCWEAIARCCDAAKLRKPTKRKVSKTVKKFLADAPYIKEMDLKINLSVEGIATTSPDGTEIISNDVINKISFAAGGEKSEYDFVTYVAKDKRDNRYCHVFDCGILSDDVLATIGQIFNILQEPTKAQEDIEEDRQKVQTLGGKLDNPLYHAMAEGRGRFEAANINTAYDDENRTYDSAAPDAYGEIDEEGETYDNVDETRGREFADFLNQNVASQPLYGEIAGEGVYGDGQAEPGWGYLDVKPDEDLYGGLADVFVDE